jgi:FKBP-type peptidyl-prolyl cis-trans isomerase
MNRLTSILLALLLAACSSGESDNASVNGVNLPSGEVTALTIIDEATGEGDVAESGRTAVVHYTGWLYDSDAADRRGAKFDSSLDRGLPFSFPLGRGRVIRGWDEGVLGMREGGKRLLFIPPEFGYGEQGAGDDIPPNATLTFQVELINVR